MPKRSRWMRWMFLCGILGVVAAFPAMAGGKASPSPAVPDPLLVKVHYGDSLWTIARENCDKNCDVRDAITLIRRANNADLVNLRPGMTLAIPWECLSADRKAILHMQENDANLGSAMVFSSSSGSKPFEDL